MSNSNFKDDILKVAGDEAIENIFIGNPDWGHVADRDDPRKIAPEFLGVLLTWEQAEPLLDYAYDTGYGGVDCHGICAWTATKVIFVSQYDGSTCVEYVPRHPRTGPDVGDIPGG